MIHVKYVVMKNILNRKMRLNHNTHRSSQTDRVSWPAGQTAEYEGWFVVTLVSEGLDCVLIEVKGW